MYTISNETLYLYYDGSNTLIKERKMEFEFCGNVLKKILMDSCIYYGSSFEGRKKGAKALIGGMYRVPIIISEKNNIIFFPVVGEKKDELIWFNFNMIKNFYKNGYFVTVEFIGDIRQDFMVSFGSFNNQIFKSSRLWLVYLTRC